MLVIEDDAAMRHGVVMALRARGYGVLEAETCEQALEHYASRPDVVITDLRLPDGDAVSLLPRLRAIDSTIPIYIITGFATIDVAVKAVKEGAEDFLTKPVEMETLIHHVEDAIAKREALRTGERLRVNAEPREPSTSGAGEITTLEQMEREYIARALTAERGRVKDAARRLGIPRSTLYQKIKNYGIQLPVRTRTGPGSTEAGSAEPEGPGSAEPTSAEPASAGRDPEAEK